MSTNEVSSFLESLRHIAGFEDLNKIEVGSRDVGGDTPLHIAIYQRNAKAALMLISAGADVNAVGEDELTPLHLAIRAGYNDVVDEILRRGGDLKKADMYGETAEEMLRSSGYEPRL